MSSAKYTLSALLATPPSERDATALQFIEELTQNADAIQKDVLAEILRQNTETEYLRPFNLGGATDPETFKSKVPVVAYEDVNPLIQRIVDGDRSPILTALPVDQFCISSGTSGGQQKLFPTVEGDWERSSFAFRLVTAVVNKCLGGGDKGKALQFRFISPGKKTGGGGQMAYSAIAEFHQKMLSNNRTKYYPHTSPIEAIICTDLFQSMYVQLLCGLYARHQIDRLGSTFASTLVQVMAHFHQNWREMARDIRTGSLNPNITDTSIRDCMTSVMRPDPELADLIATECDKTSWEGIIPRLWPNAKCIISIVTGSLSQYVPDLRSYGGGLPIISPSYACSECFLGVNLNPLCDPTEVVYTFLPNMAYFEFLEDGTSGDLVDLVDVEIGKEYELVVTTHAGLYRYHVGDVLRVSSFHNSTPQFQFLRRKSVVLSIHLEKTCEDDLQVSVENASRFLRDFGVSIVEYTSYGDITTVPGHYVIYLELATNSVTVDDEQLEACCLVMEDSLHSLYRKYRAVNKSIGALEIRVVKNGTFNELMKQAISRGATIAQYKVPRCITSTSMLHLFEARVISKHFSPSFPQFSVD